MTAKSLIKEHRKLVRVLERKAPYELNKELKKQRRELSEYES